MRWYNNKPSFYTSEFGVKFKANGYLNVGTRLGVRCNRHLFVGIVGMSFPSFSGSVWKIREGNFVQANKVYKNRMFPFIQLGAEYSYSVTKAFDMGLSYVFNKGRVQLSKIDEKRSIKGKGSRSYVYRSKSANFSVIMGILRYSMRSSR